jgi:hypothetical protein
VNSVEDAVGLLYTTGLDALVIHEFVIETNRGASTFC